MLHCIWPPISIRQAALSETGGQNHQNLPSAHSRLEPIHHCDAKPPRHRENLSLGEFCTDTTAGSCFFRPRSTSPRVVGRRQRYRPPTPTSPQPRTDVFFFFNAEQRATRIYSLLAKRIAPDRDHLYPPRAITSGSASVLTGGEVATTTSGESRTLQTRVYGLHHLHPSRPSAWPAAEPSS